MSSEKQRDGVDGKKAKLWRTLKDQGLKYISAVVLGIVIEKSVHVADKILALAASMIYESQRSDAENLAARNEVAVWADYDEHGKLAINIQNITGDQRIYSTTLSCILLPTSFQRTWPVEPENNYLGSRYETSNTLIPHTQVRTNDRYDESTVEISTDYCARLVGYEREPFDDVYAVISFSNHEGDLPYYIDYEFYVSDVTGKWVTDGKPNLQAHRDYFDWYRTGLEKQRLGDIPTPAP